MAKITTKEKPQTQDEIAADVSRGTRVNGAILITIPFFNGKRYGYKKKGIAAKTFFHLIDMILSK